MINNKQLAALLYLQQKDWKIQSNATILKASLPFLEKAYQVSPSTSIQFMTNYA